VVERSDDEAFTNPVIVSNSYKPAGLAWLAVDASWDGDARPYYRVIVTNTSTSTREVSPVRQPTDQEGGSQPKEAERRALLLAAARWALAPWPPGGQGVRPHPAALTPLLSRSATAGNLYVVANANVTEGVPCGDLLTAPCADIKSALAAAPAGSTIYVVPGESPA
jgi:hypothetical protein